MLSVNVWVNKARDNPLKPLGFLSLFLRPQERPRGDRDECEGEEEDRGEATGHVLNLPRGRLRRSCPEISGRSQLATGGQIKVRDCVWEGFKET
jgi:hypothetical protein